MTGPKAAYIATVYSHLRHFHLPFMRRLQSRGYTVHAYASPDHCRAEVAAAGFDCRDVPFRRSPLSAGNVRALRQMIDAFRRENYDLIHVHTPNASAVCRIAARIAGCRNVIYTAHGFHFHGGAPLFDWLAYYPVERLLSRWTDVLITINSEDYARALKFPVRGRTVHVPGVGVDVRRFRTADAGRSASLRRDLGLAEGDFVALSVAELNRNKNHEQFIFALRQLRDQGLPAFGMIAGVGSREMKLKALVRKLRMEDRIAFLGFRRDIAALMQAADVVVLLSRREGFPKVLLEAMAAGKPMVVTDVRGSRDLVRDGQNGWRVPFGDAAATAQALGRLYARPDERMQMGNLNASQATAYDIRNILERMDLIYAGRDEGTPQELGDIVPRQGGVRQA
jgi:glycosyltransferase involved in cell wall biosynthesis